MTPRCQILSVFAKRDAGTTFKFQNFKIIANKSECIKIKSSYKCLDLMHTEFHGLAHLLLGQAKNFSAYHRSSKSIRNCILESLSYQKN